jgi:hypothetical protein
LDNQPGLIELSKRVAQDEKQPKEQRLRILQVDARLFSLILRRQVRDMIRLIELNVIIDRERRDEINNTIDDIDTVELLIEQLRTTKGN